MTGDARTPHPEQSLTEEYGADVVRTLRDLLSFADTAARLVARGYEQVDYEIIWNALTGRLPREMDVVRRFLRDSGEPA